MEDYTVYMHINKINDKRYVGLTKQNVWDRWRMQGTGYRNQIKFWRAIEKYGWDNFEHQIIAEHLTAHQAGELEKQLIQQYDCINNGYNVSPGGEITNHSPETLEKMRQSMLGKKHTQETKDKISAAKKDIKIPVKCLTTGIVYESGAKAAAATGVDASSIAKCCQGQVNTAGKMDWEYADDEHKQQYAKYKEQKKDKRYKPVKCTTTGIVYNNVHEAAADTKSDPSNIIKVCKGRYKTTNGLKWEYVNE